MNNWIPFENSSYLAEQAFLMAEDDTAVALEKTVITVYTGKGGKQHLKGSGLVRNALVVELLDENDALDLILDFGNEFKYRLTAPTITAGKVFAPDVESTLQFVPTSPWQQIPESEFEILMGKLELIYLTDT
jgi:hypothetical protein